MSEIQGITWFLKGDFNLGSSRLQGYLIHNDLKNSGDRSQIIFAPPYSLSKLPWSEQTLVSIAKSIPAGIVVFQKITDKRLPLLIDILKERGIKTIYVQCDLRNNDDLISQCDYLFVTSKYLFDHYSKLGFKCRRILDPLEYIRSKHEIIQWYQSHIPSKGIRLVWVGSKEHWDTIHSLQSMLKKSVSPIEVITISNHPKATYPWTRQSVVQDILRGDIGVVPTSDQGASKAKSANRVTLYMALGLPVVAGSIPAYHEVIKGGQSGYIATSEQDWFSAISLLENIEVRMHIALNAYDTVVPQYTIRDVANMWLDHFQQISDQSSAAPSLNWRPDWRKFRWEAYLSTIKQAVQSGDKKMLLQCFRNFRSSLFGAIPAS